MSVDSPDLTGLETLPTEILQAVVDLLPLWDIKSVSCTSKRLRGASLTPLFRHVKFKFSQAGIEGLKRLLKSEISRHITSFNYEVPELLKTGRHTHYYAEFTLMLLVTPSRHTRFRSFQVRRPDS
jgi:hypothetical protein